MWSVVKSGISGIHQGQSLNDPKGPYILQCSLIFQFQNWALNTLTSRIKGPGPVQCSIFFFNNCYIMNSEKLELQVVEASFPLLGSWLVLLDKRSLESRRLDRKFTKAWFSLFKIAEWKTNLWKPGCKPYNASYSSLKSVPLNKDGEFLL